MAFQIRLRFLLCETVRFFSVGSAPLIWYAKKHFRIFKNILMVRFWGYFYFKARTNKYPFLTNCYQTDFFCYGLNKKMTQDSKPIINT
ncbi:hypothetical protein OA88_03765 [Flavobacterium sp. JRM]|nr:hypothetical protein OA88_03765 [Flavobacterium sp. JRM]